MTDLRTSIVVDLAGNLERRARQFGQSFGRLSQVGQQQLGRLQRNVDLLSRGVDRLGNRYTALLTGAGGAGALRFVTSLDSRLRRLQTSSSATAEQISKLNDEIFRVANQPDIRVDPSEITSAIETIVEMVGDIDFASNNVRNIGLALQASGADGADVGGFMAELQKKGIRDSKDVLATIDALVQQGKAGAFVFKDLANQGSRLFVSYKKQGQDSVVELGALVQVVRQATGSSEQATTSVEALFRTLQDVQKVKDIEQKIGVQVRVRDANGKPTKEIRNVTDILTELVDKTKGDPFILGRVFDAEAMRAINGLLINGNMELLKRLRTIKATGEVIQQDAKINAESAASAGRSIVTALQKAADRKLTEPLQNMADALNSIDPERLDAIVDRVIKIGATVGAVVIGLKTVKLIAGTISAVRGARGGAVGNALTAAAGGMTPVPVIVVGGSLGGGAGGYGGLNKAAAGYSFTDSLAPKLIAPKGRIARFLAGGSRSARLLRGGGRLLGRFGGPLALLSGGAMLADTLLDDHKSTTAKIVDSSSIIGGTGGALAGAAAGAALGSVVPVIGTAVGGIIGGILGSLGGEFAARKGAQYLTAADIGREVGKAVNDKTEVHVKIDQEGRGGIVGTRGRNRRKVTVDTGIMLATP